MLDNIDDKSLIKNFLKEDKKAIAIIKNWVTLVVRHMIKLGILNKRECDDLIQEALKEIWQNLQNEKYQYQSRLKTYVCRTAEVVCLKHGRRETRRWKDFDVNQYDIVDTAPDPSRIVEQLEQDRIFAEAKRRAPERCRKLWQMLFEQEMDYQEIAQALGTSYGNVRVNYTRCKERLIAIIQELTSKKSKRGKIYKIDQSEG